MAVFDAWPQKKAQKGAGVILSNDPSAFIGLQVRAFPIAELWRLANPCGGASEDLKKISSGRELFKLWQNIEAKFLKFPHWVLAALANVYMDLEDEGLCKLFLTLAKRVAPDADDTHWEYSIAAENSRSVPARTPALEDCSSLDEDHIAGFFAADGALSRMMPNYHPRAGQIQMARSVARAFNTGCHLLAEAGTGVGKSLAYLLPAASWATLNDVAVVVSTNTKNLQTQLIEHDLPIVRKVLSGDGGGEIRCALLKGRTNYLCLRKFGMILEQNDFSFEPPKRRQFAAIVPWVAFTDDGDLDKLQLLHQVQPSFASEFASSGEECSGRKCRFFKRCFLQKARQIAARSHIIVANHALVFADAAAPGNILPLYSQVVFDEAHNLEEAATTHYSTTVSISGIGKLLRRISSTKGSKGIVERIENSASKGSFPFDDEELESFLGLLKDCSNSVKLVNRAAQRFFGEMERLLSENAMQTRYRCRLRDEEGSVVREYVRSRVFVPCTAPRWDEERASSSKNGLCLAIAAVIERLRDSANMLSNALPPGSLPLFGDQCALLEGVAAELECLSADVEFVFGAADEESVFWVEARNASRSARQRELILNAAPLSVGTALAKDFYKTKSSVIFSSATLRYGESFSFVGKRLGLGLADVSRVKTSLAQSPFDYLRQCKVIAADFLPSPESGAGGYNSYVEQLGALLVEIFSIGKGRALALFTSFEMMNAVASQVEKALRDISVELLVHGRDGSRDEITARFRADGSSVLFGVQSFWEGVDIPGEALNCVVICRLPFAAVGDPVFEARCEQLKVQGKSDFREYSLPQAVIKFRQGFGRLIRTASDRGAVIVADPRLIKKGYGAEFRKSLPCPVAIIGSREELLAQVRASIL